MLEITLPRTTSYTSQEMWFFLLPICSLQTQVSCHVSWAAPFPLLSPSSHSSYYPITCPSSMSSCENPQITIIVPYVRKKKYISRISLEKNMLWVWRWDNFIVQKKFLIDSFFFVWSTKNLDVRLDTIKLLEENIGRALCDTNCSNIFSVPPSRVMKIKTKINKWLSNEAYCIAQGTIPSLLGLNMMEESMIKRMCVCINI